MILERVAGTTLSAHFERSIWKRIGAEYDATWTIDHACPGKRLVVARFGRGVGAVDQEWPMLMRAVAESLP